MNDKIQKIDVCHYCGLQFHPMMVWASNSKVIYVCQYTFVYDDKGEIAKVIPGSECEKKAQEDGYVKRRDLTPSR